MSRTAEEQRRLDFVLEMYREVLIAQDSSKVDQYISPDYLQHSSLAPPGREALKSFLDMIRVRSPQASTEIHRAVIEGRKNAACRGDQGSRRVGDEKDATGAGAT